MKIFLMNNDVKRYLIFGKNGQENKLIKNNSNYQIHSENGFFSVSILSEKNASNLISKGIM